MLREQRCNIILSEVNRKDSVTIEELMALTNSSRSTIRRDIKDLENKHSLCCVRGGVMKTQHASFSQEAEPSFSARQDMYLEEKKRIAVAAHSLVCSNETLFLSGGTTVYEFAKTLSDVSPLYVATNDLKSAIALSEFHNLSLTVLGGSLRQRHYSLNGYFTENMIKQMHADKAFIGIDAVDFNIGYMNFSTEEIQTNRMLIQASHESIVLCDHSKFDSVAFVNICKLQEIDLLITGKELSEEHSQKLKQLNINFITV